jgi:hypothetical protein
VNFGLSGGTVDSGTKIGETYGNELVLNFELDVGLIGEWWVGTVL